MRKVIAALGSALLLTLTGPAALAQTFPKQQPIRLVVPFTPGGAPDMIARLLAPEMATRLGTSVIVENKPGAGGNIGTDFVARSTPDGHTILITTAGLTSAPWVSKNLPFDVKKDFAPVGALVSLPLVVAVNNNLPVKSVPELIAYAKANPGKLSYGSSGNGTLHHLAAEMFKTMTNTDIVHVPYKGAAGLLNDLIAGQVQLMFGALNSALPQIQAGRVRALALGDKTRNPVMDLPVVAETVPGFDATFWFGTAVPAGTPQSVIRQLSELQREIVKKPDVAKKLQAAGFDITTSTPEEMTVRMSAEMERWRQITQAAHIVAE
jgi:tripartite-type tricarboxylate transporter receptor subunit TctC